MRQRLARLKRYAAAYTARMDDSAGFSADVVVRASAHGRGLFAARPYRAGQTILRFTGCTYSGEALDRAGFVPGYPLQIDEQTFMLLDAPGVFCNHSCDANAGLAADLRLFAVRDIAQGEEICFDYSATMMEDNAWTLDCRCGTPQCRGRVEDFDRLPPAKRRQLLAQGVVLPFIARKCS